MHTEQNYIAKQLAKCRRGQ